MKDMVFGDTAKISKGQKRPFEPFGNTTAPTSFEIVFMYRGIRYAYGFSFDEEKVHNEYLYHWPNGREALIFSQENGKYEFRENVGEQITLSNRTPENKLYLVSSNDWNLPQTENAYKWFLEKLIFFTDQTPLPSETISRIGGWLQALENGSLLVVDEIEDSLHPLLTRRLIEMIQDDSINTNGAQLLFTTHDAMLFDVSFLRRDQIWFAEKNERSCATEVYSLSTFSLRKGENIRKGYLQGRFGAVPFIGSDGL